MREESTPTYRMVGESLVKLTTQIDREIRERDKPLSFARLNDIAETICMIFDDDEVKPGVIGGFTRGLIDLQAAAISAPEVADEIGAGAQKLLIAMCNVAIVIARDRMRAEVERIAPLARRNQEKEEVMDRAKTLAQEFWAKDDLQQMRSGAMAEKVYRKLADEGMIDLLPGSVERLKAWIKPVAPAYAKKGGREKTSRP